MVLPFQLPRQLVGGSGTVGKGVLPTADTLTTFVPLIVLRVPAPVCGLVVKPAGDSLTTRAPITAMTVFRPIDTPTTRHRACALVLPASRSRFYG